MPDIDPPATPPGEVQIDLVPVGTPLWRIHGPNYQATQMNPVPRPTELAGGRFDSLAGDYSYLYLAGDLDGAMAEAIFRDLPLDGRPRRILKAAWSGLRVSELVVTRTIAMAACHGAALAHLGQDLWLTTCDPVDYVKTRRWAAAIRRWAPDTDGLLYRCRNDNDRLAAVLFAPPTQRRADCLEIVTESDLTDPVIFDVLQKVALRHHAILG